MSKFSYCIFIFLLIFPTIIFSEEKATLKADHMYYNEATRLVIASSNARLVYDDLEITAPKLNLDVDKEVVWGSGNITIHRGENTIKASSLLYDIGQDKVVVEDVNIATKPKEVTTGNLYIKVQKLEDFKDKKRGKKGIVTTCSYQPPHYSFSADRFDYYPDDSIVGHNVLINAPIYFIPFGFWMPMYYYALGKRNPVLLMPKIGENDTEGWFVKTPWDYVVTKDHLGRFYIDWMEKVGWGFGFKHKYRQKKDFTGSLYLYSLLQRSPF